MKKILEILSWLLMGLALAFFIGIFVFSIKEDRENTFTCMILGWTTYLAAGGARYWYKSLKY
jgi:hypothetical protein